MIRVPHQYVAVIVTAALLATLLTFASLPKTSGAQERPQGKQSVTNETERGTRYVVGELLVTLEQEAPSRAVSTLGDEVRAETEQIVPELDIELFRFAQIKTERSEKLQEQSLEEIKRELERDPLVEDVGYNYVVYPRFVPNDKLYSRQYGPQRIRTPRAWNSALGEGVRIGVIDTGIEASHPDLVGKVVAQRDFYSGDGIAEDNKAEDEFGPFGHGTQVAGVAAANTDNRRGIVGICPKCDLIAGKFIGPNGGSIADSLKAIDFAVNNGAKVLNLSYGYIGPASPQEEALINRVWDQGVFLAAAVYEGFPMGEYGTQNDWPAAYDPVMAVSATDEKDRRASSANYGPYIDITAPGVGILSTDNTGSYSLNSGTSFSAPHVSAVAGLLAGKGLSNREIRKRIECTAIDLGARGYDSRHGHGRVDAYAAVSQPCGGPPEPPNSTACTVTGTNGNDYLRGTNVQDVICGLGGNDRISGLSGDDVIRGGPGSDLISGGAGNDRIEGAQGNDNLSGEQGDDRLSGGPDNDRLVGGLGRDRLDGSGGKNQLIQ